MLGSQGIPLYSVDGSVFIEITPAGVFALFNTETGSIIYQFLSTSTTNTPLSLTQQTVRLQHMQLSHLWPAPSLPSLQAKCRPSRAHS